MNKKDIMSRKLFIVTIVLAVFVLSVSVGYAFFSKSLSIHGVASTLDYYSGSKLPHTPVKLNARKNVYYTSNYNDEYTYLTANGTRLTEGYYYALVSENWEDDTYVITFDKAMLGAFQGKTITYTASFTNPTVLTYTDGAVTTTSGNVLSGSTVSTAAGTTTDVSSASATLSTTTLAPNNNVTLSLSITLGTMNFDADSVIKASVGYRLYEDNGNISGMRYFNFIVKYDSNINVNNLFNADLLTQCYDKSVTKVNNGYLVGKYSFSCTAARSDSIIDDLKSKLEAGATYRLYRDYQGTQSGSSGVVRIKDSSGSNLVTGVYNRGIRYVDFTLTQEQIDSINQILVYGSQKDPTTSLFTFIRIVKISD